jgi:hypothetical protein
MDTVVRISLVRKDAFHYRRENVVVIAFYSHNRSVVQVQRLFLREYAWKKVQYIWNYRKPPAVLSRMRRCIAGRELPLLTDGELRKSAHSEKCLSFSEAWLRCNQLDE